MLGSLFSAATALFGANQKKKAGKAAAAAQREATENAKFKPYNVTTGLATSKFDRENGTATYELDDRLRNLQGQMFQMGQAGLPQSTDTTAAAQGLFDRYQQMMAPTREQQFAQLQNSQFNNGTLGLSMGATSNGLGNSNPALQSFMNSQFLQDQQLALQADENARRYMDQDIDRAKGLFAYGMGLEQPGYQAMDYGSALGAKQASSGANVATGLIGASNTLHSARNNYIDSIANFTMGQQSGFGAGGGFGGSSGGSSDVADTIQQAVARAGGIGGGSGNIMSLFGR